VSHVGSVILLSRSWVVVDRLSMRLVPDELWVLAQPLIPQFTPRPQSGGTAPVEDRAVLTAIVYVLTSGCGWRELPPSFRVTVPTAHRRLPTGPRPVCSASCTEPCRRVGKPGLDRLAESDPGRRVRAGEKGDQ
jgi:transposase